MPDQHEHKTAPAAHEPVKAASPAAQAELAKSKEQHDKILAEHKEREKWMPTPTQEENDQAALGNPVADKKPDGSPIEETPEQQRNKQMEAKKPSGSYSTRSAS